MQLAAKCSLVQRLNVFQSMLEAIAAQIDLIFRDRIKHESVVRIRRMSESEDFGRAPHCRMLSAAKGHATTRVFPIVICVIRALPIASDTWRRWRRPVSARVSARSSALDRRRFGQMSILASRFTGWGWPKLS